MPQEKYEKLRDELLQITTDISAKMTPRKFLYRLKNLTVKKVVRKIRVKSKKYRVFWKGPGHMLVVNAQIAEGQRQHVSDGVGGLEINSSPFNPST
jgi:hypothetical protein